MSRVTKALLLEINNYQDSRRNGNHEACVHYLGRAHIIAQRRWFHHFYIHALMLEYAWSRKDFREFFGQGLRLVATVPGHLTGRIPVGNTGWSTVKIMERMPLPKDLEALLSQSQSGQKKG